ncbi:hypothetical protein RhiirA1_442189 [Rhizophagus irregularis]|uniref:DUF6826 domain-containing protein n=1 Tax=Rhizophagus irregularis TaxID=588596 RepID=A0A2N0RQN5_9GLOM|nr:hypothetical protein RhiirA1_442189 [Rhizophagus irregularis]
MEYYISRIKQGAFLGNFANNGSVERYLREHSTPTSTEEEVQNWFNGLMMELPSFKRKILVESTHNDPYLDGFKPANIEVPQQKSVEIQKFLEVRNIQEVRVFLKFLTQISSKSLAKENARRFPGKFKDINEPFATFYNNYVEAIDNAMTKNFASCALGALLKDNELRFRVVRCNYGSFIRETICLIEAHCTEKI